MLCLHCFRHLLSKVIYFILGRYCGGSFRSWVLALSKARRTLGSQTCCCLLASTVHWNCIRPITTSYMTAYQLITSTYTPDDCRCIKFNNYFMNTWLSENDPIAKWNQFRSDVPRTNNSCEGYNSRLTKRALQPHLNIYALIMSCSKKRKLTRRPIFYSWNPDNDSRNVASNTAKLTMI